MSEPSYKTSLLQRIQDIIAKSDIELTDQTSFSYSWDAGYEKFTLDGFTFLGSYHPNAVCEGEGICKHCGRTLRFD